MKHLPLNNHEYERYYRDFSREIYARGYKRGINGAYANDLREFLFFMESKGVSKIHDVVPTDIFDYHEYLKERPNQRREGGLSDGMIHTKLYSLRLFFDYMVTSGEMVTSPANFPKFKIHRKSHREICTVEEIKQMYDVAQNKMEKAIISLAYGCGLRKAEVERLNVSDIQMYKGMLTVREGKNSKSRTVPLSDSVLKDLKDYIINERQHYTKLDEEPDEALLLNRLGKRLMGNLIGEKVKEIIERTKNPELMKKNITLHCLRHSIATHLTDKGASIEFVQKFLGHAQIDTSHLYARRRKQQLKVMQMFEKG